MKVYVVEFINKDVEEYIKENFEITQNKEEADIILTRNLIVDKNFLDECKNVKCVAMYGTGMDAIDLKECDRRGIVYFNSPKQNSLSVAELNVTLMLSISRKLNNAFENVKKGIIDYDNTYGNEISSKTVGFIGLGDISLKTARILHYGFNNRIIAYSRSKKNIDYIEELSMEEVFKQSDYVLLGLPLNNETKGIITLRQLSLMKKKAYLINCARGALVNYNDLLYALQNKILLGYASDVFEIEPIDKNDPLLKENVIATNHIGANSEESLYRVGKLLVDKMINFSNEYEKKHNK